VITSSNFEADRSGVAVEAEHDGSVGRIFADGVKKSVMGRFDDIMRMLSPMSCKS
jgi:hypothetical protein